MKVSTYPDYYIRRVYWKKKCSTVLLQIGGDLIVVVVIVK